MVPTTEPAVTVVAPAAPQRPRMQLCLPAPEEVRDQTSALGSEAQARRAVREEAAAAADAVAPDVASEALTSDSLTSAALTPDGLRDVVDVAETLADEVRPQVLLDLASAGPANVSLLAARTGIAANTLSHHLTKLRDKGLLDCRRKGKEHWYEPVPGRIQFQRQADGQFSLTITGRSGGLAMTVGVGTVR